MASGETVYIFMLLYIWKAFPTTRFGFAYCYQIKENKPSGMLIISEIRKESAIHYGRLTIPPGHLVSRSFGTI
jgi:hypothetical protein